MVNFRVHVIRATSQDDATAAVLLHPLEGLPALGPYILFGPALFGPGSVDCPAGFSFGDIPDLPAQLLQPGGSRLFIGHGDERTYVGDIALCHRVDVVF